MNGHSEKVNFIWSIADLLRGDYKQSEYGRVILPFTVLRRLDCVLEDTKKEVLEKKKELENMGIEDLDPILNRTAGYNFHNSSRFDFQKLLNDSEHIKKNLIHYINGFSSNAREIIDYFNFEVHINRLDEADLLYLIVQRFSEVDIHPDTVSNKQMGDIFEELIRKFSEQSNETAGEHFTPREVIRLMVNLMFDQDDDALQKEGIVRTIYDPACGTGGMLTIADDYLDKLNKEATLKMFGQELNPESYAICKSDMLIKGEDVDNIKYGNSFTNDQLKSEKFDYMLSNPPFGVSWKKVRDEIEDEADQLGYDGRFGAGTPRVNDGSLLFLQHMISKMKSNGSGSRIAIVFNGSPLFTGGAGSGESEIRRWIIENDWLETIVALPEELFYNTGIATYVWILTNRKTKEREDTKRVNRALRDRNSRSNSSRNRRSSGHNNRLAVAENVLNPDEDRKNALENAPSKHITKQYKLAENPNPFLKDSFSQGTKYNNYQMRVANPNYNEYINKQNEKYSEKHTDWNNLATNNFQSESMMSGLYGNPIPVRQESAGGLLGKFFGGLNTNHGFPAGSIFGLKRFHEIFGINPNNNNEQTGGRTDPGEVPMGLTPEDRYNQFIEAGDPNMFQPNSKFNSKLSLARNALFG